MITASLASEEPTEKTDRWERIALGVLEVLANGCPEGFTADRWHHYMRSEPHHPNQYGIVARRARAQGVIRETGEWVKSKRKEARGRRIPVWVAGPGCK